MAYDPKAKTRSVLLGTEELPAATSSEDLPPPPQRLSVVRREQIPHVSTPALPPDPAASGQPDAVIPDPPDSPKKWGSRKGRVWQIHVTLTREAAELLEANHLPHESVGSTIIRTLRDVFDALAAECIEGDDVEDDLFADPGPPVRRYRVPDGVRKHFDLTARQRDGLSDYMERLGATNLSFVISRALALAFAKPADNQRRGSVTDRDGGRQEVEEGQPEKVPFATSQ